MPGTNTVSEPQVSRIKTYIQSCLDLPEQELDDISKQFESRTIPRKTLLLKAGDICTFEGFIKKGCVKTYFIDDKDREVILTLATENWWVSDLISFEEKIKSHMFIETIEDTELLLLTPATKNDLLKKYPALEKMFRHIVQRHLRTYQERRYANSALSAEARYAEFLAKYPLLVQRVPQMLIASYLGMSAESLSRIRSKQSKKQTSFS